MAAAKRTTKNRILLTAVILVLCSCGFLGGAAFWAGNTLESRVRSLPFHLEEARRLGLPTTIEELKVQIKDPREDALPDLEAAQQEWLALSADDRGEFQRLTRKCLRGQATEEDRATYLALRSQVQTLVDRLAAAAQKPACSVPDVETWRDRKQGAFWGFVRDGVRIFAADAVIGKSLAGSENSLITAAGLASHLTAQPSYLPMMRRCASEMEIQRATERVAFAQRKDPMAAAGLIRRMQEHFDPLPSAAQVMTGELPMILHALSDSKRTGLENVPAGEYFADVGKSGSLEIWNRYYRKLPSDPNDQNEAERVLIAMDSEAEATPFYGSYVNGYHRIIPMLRDVLARKRLAEVAVRYLESGETGELPEDPHTGQPLLTKKTDKALVVYSVGRDAKDNGGKEREVGKNASPEYDILFRVPLK